MSLGARATKGGAGGAGAKGKDRAPEKAKGAAKPPSKDKVKPQQSSEQLRMAHIIDRKSEDTSDVRRMVLELMEMTCRTEEEVCSALHDSDNDMAAACNLLFEDTPRTQSEWQTSEKKKKKPPAAAGNGEPEPPRDRDREPRERSGPPRTRRGESEPGRGRGGGAGRGRGALRGRGRGARRPPASRARPARMHDDAPYTGNNVADSFPNAEDWDNEEWSGSLSDTKVFTPSTSGLNADEQPVNNSTEDWDAPAPAAAANGPPEHIPSYTYHARLPDPPRAPDMSAPHLPVTVPSEPAPAEPQPRHQSSMQPMGMSGSLSAAQSQYLSQLTQQSQRHDNSVYSSNYGVYGSADIASQRKPQRARVPPPSKIPSSAVEMPGGEGGAMFLDVQFGALEPDALQDAAPAPLPPPPALAPPPHKPPTPKPPPQQAAPPLEPPAAAHDAAAEAPGNSYPVANSMLPESMTTESPAAPPPAEPAAPPANNLEKQLTAAMKQLAVSAGDAPAAAPQHHRHKTVGQQNVYAPHHAVSHHPPVYGANVYAPQQVNSTNASLTGAAGMSAAAYASNATLTQYQPMLNSYQTSSSAGVYAGSALYTYQPSPQTKLPAKDTPQYDNSVASSNSLTSTSTTQTSTAKVATTTVSNAAGGTGAAAGYGGALYGGVAGAPTGYAHYDEAQLLTRTLPHPMTGYYEVGYGVGGAREGTFGLGPTERFTRTDAASPQQVSQVPAALPPGYAYFYQPPPTTYQYGVYPTYGGGSSVGGVGGVGAGAGGVAGAGKSSSYAQQQPAYDQDAYKPGGGYNANANKTAAAPPELASAMYAKTHQALNKVNSYDKATFHSGTPPPFGAGSHLYIPAPQQHHHPHHPHQMDVRVNSSHNRRESGAARAAAKPAPSKPSYSQSYWAPN